MNAPTQGKLADRAGGGVPQSRVTWIEDLDGLRLDVPRVCTLHIDEPVSFGDQLDLDLRHLWRLREATSAAVRLVWTLRGCPQFDDRDFTHLVPPTAAASADALKVVRRWRHKFSYGSFYYRVGPNFVSIKDVRPDGEHSRIIIADEDAQRFLRLTQSGMLDRPDDLDALEVLTAAGIALRASSTHLVLPFRVRHWPVPFLAI